MAIMISVKPEWCRKILNKEKSDELRTTCPKEWKDYLSGKTNVKPESTKGYIYCTKIKDKKWYTDEVDIPLETEMYMGNGRVIAEFTLNNVTKHEKNFIDAEDNLSYNFLTEDVIKIGFNNDLEGLCDFDSFVENYGNGKPLYAWHIDELKIYEKPKELSEFNHWVVDCYGWNSKKYKKENCYVLEPMQRPPQSWCYVEELEEE